MVRVMRKLNDYQGRKIPEIWLVNTDTREWFRFENGQAVLRTQFSRPGMTFSLSEIEALVDL
jgi:Uma2 family endonuclease